MRTFHLTRSTSIAIALLMIGTSAPLASAQDGHAGVTADVFRRYDRAIADSRVAQVDGSRAADSAWHTRRDRSSGIDTSALDRYLERNTAARLAAWVAVDAPPTLDAMTAWRETLRGVFARHANTVAILEVVFHNTPADLQRFALEVAATEARARGSEVLVAASGVDAAATSRMATQLTADQAPYLDLFVLDDAMSDAGRARTSRPRGAPSLL